VLLYDADRIEEAASTEHETDLYERQCDVFLNPNDPAVIEEALKQGIPQNVIDAAQRSPVYKMAMDWKLALPLHPEYRTLPMVWYVPPLSPIQSYADAGGLPQSDGVLPAVESLRIPVQYLANMLSAGDTGPVLRALKRMMAMRHYKRSQTVEGVTDTRAIEEVGLTEAQVEEMYRYLAIANYEDRFVIPTSHREMARDAFPGEKRLRLHLRRRLSRLRHKIQPLQQQPHRRDQHHRSARSRGGRVMQILKIIALLIEYPDELLWENRDEALSLVEQDAPMLLPFAQQHLSAPLLDKQAEWCEVFERGRATSLLLFEHVHAESRDRGQAMVDLMSQYEKAGLELDCRELPDYLPLYLEYLSIVSDDEAREGLQNVAPILALIGGRLKQREVAHY